MALLFIEGFDNMHQQSSGTGWTTENFSTISPGRFGDGRYGQSPGSRVFQETTGEIIIGGALYATNNADWVGLRIGNTSNSECLTIMVHRVYGYVQVRRGSDSGTILATSNFGLYSTQIWNYLEAKVKIHNTTGSYALRMNGVAIPGLPDVSGIDTNVTTLENSSRLGFFTGGSFSTWYIDDFYLADTTGSVNNDFLGDVRVETLVPNGNNSVQWTPTTTSNWQAVDEMPADDDTSYVSSSTVGHKDLYTLSDLSTTSGTIYGVQADIRARKTDSGTRGVAAVLKSGATEADTTEYGTIAAQYMYFREVFENKPGGTGWTISEVNDLLLGVKVVE